jgi:hypothetical protein
MGEFSPQITSKENGMLPVREKLPRWAERVVDLQRPGSARDCHLHSGREFDEAGLPLNAIQRRGHLISRFMPKVHNDQLVDHVSILERSKF